MLRMPDGMRDRLKSEAEKNSRSMNAEIVALLDQGLNDGGVTKADLAEVIERQNKYISDQKIAMEKLSEVAAFQMQTIETMSRTVKSEADLAINILRHILNHIDVIPPSLTVWADYNLRILDKNSDWIDNSADEDVVLNPNTPENRGRFTKMVGAARERQDSYLKETIARIRERSSKSVPE